MQRKNNNINNVLKHLVAEDLKRMQAMSLADKVKRTQYLIKEWYEHFDGNVAISFSGGKDSTVLLHIARKLYPNIQAVYFDTGLEYPEIRSHVKTFDNVLWLKPKKNFRKIILDYGYPIISKDVSQKVYEIRNSTENMRRLRLQGIKPDGSNSFGVAKLSNKYHYLINAPFKISAKCCYHMKKSLSYRYEKETANKMIIATMAEESSLRFISWAKYGCNAFDSKKQQSRPMSFWTEQDVLKYIKENNIIIAKVYGDIVENDGLLKCTGLSRTGCMFCMYGVQFEETPNRFERMKITHPKQYEWCMKDVDKGGLGLGKVLNFIGVNH